MQKRGKFNLKDWYHVLSAASFSILQDLTQNLQQPLPKNLKYLGISEYFKNIVCVCVCALVREKKNVWSL